MNRNKIFADIRYIMLINELGKHLKNEYKISDMDLQKLKYEINQIVERVVE